MTNMLEGGVTPLHTAQEMQDMGFHIVVYPLSGLYSAAKWVVCLSPPPLSLCMCARLRVY